MIYGTVSVYPVIYGTVSFYPVMYGTVSFYLFYPVIFFNMRCIMRR